jgi:hypothetical protein
MNSSSLNEHLFIRNLVDSPNCACGQVESTSHFSISCKKYTDLRNELMYTINYPITIDVKLLLKGSDTLSAVFSLRDGSRRISPSIEVFFPAILFPTKEEQVNIIEPSDPINYSNGHWTFCSWH